MYTPLAFFVSRQFVRQGIVLGMFVTVVLFIVSSITLQEDTFVYSITNLSTNSATYIFLTQLYFTAVQLATKYISECILYISMHQSCTLGSLDIHYSCIINITKKCFHTAHYFTCSPP